MMRKESFFPHLYSSAFFCTLHISERHDNALRTIFRAHQQAFLLHNVQLGIFNNARLLYILQYLRNRLQYKSEAMISHLLIVQKQITPFHNNIKKGVKRFGNFKINAYLCPANLTISLLTKTQ